MEISLVPPSAAEFVDLYTGTGWGTLDETVAARALDGSWLVCTARDEDGALAGMGRLLGDGALHAFVTELIVREDLRGRGVGARLLDRMVLEAQGRGVRDVQLFAARDRAPFYERHGFVRRPDDAPGMGHEGRL
ncbi:GNAT family N-acetyltransferase [Cellulomonas soli]|uniref:GNAT family N-acetyltransferase n=1 Tax=Cellulomonas soli TaxID=931535 RepID=UPI003F831985